MSFIELKSKTQSIFLYELAMISDKSNMPDKSPKYKILKSYSLMHDSPHWTNS